MKKVFLGSLLGLILSLVFFSFAEAVVKINVRTEEREKEVFLTWDKVLGASSYKVYRDGKDVSTKDHTRLPTNSFSDTEVQEGKKYTYTVMALDSGGQEIGKSPPTKRLGLKTTSTTAPPATGTATGTGSAETPVPIGAQFPGEAPEIGLVDHIMIAHRWASFAGGLLAVLMIIWAGFKYATSSGNPEALQDAKDTIIGALLGLSIIILTYFLLQIFGARVEKAK